MTDAADWLLDVNSDGWVSPLDALLVINELNDSQRDMVAVNGSATYLLDVNANGYLSPRNALLIINFLNQPRGAEGEYSRDTAVPQNRVDTGVPNRFLSDTHASLSELIQTETSNIESHRTAVDAEGE